MIIAALLFLILLAICGQLSVRGSFLAKAVLFFVVGAALIRWATW